MRLSLYPIADSYLLVAGAALVLLALLMVGPGRERVGRQRRHTLIGVRLAVVLLLILAMLRPTLVYTRTEKEAATLAVLADRSRSMGVPDEIGDKTRWEAQRRTLAEARSALAELGEDLEIAAFTFDAEARPAEVIDGRIRLPEQPDGDQTAIGAVLDDVLRAEAGKRLLGIVLLSDGAQRVRPPRDVLPQTAASRLKSLGFPLFTIRFGKSRGLGQAQDLAVKDLLANPRVFVKTELSVTGQIRADGFVNREIPVQLLVEGSSGRMETVDQQNLKVRVDGELIPVKFTYVPQLPGEYKISLEAVPQRGELVETNNRLSTFVHVLKGGLNVLCMEDFPARPEQNFIRRALDASPEIRVDVVNPDPRVPETRLADLAERLKPGKYEVYLLGNLDASVFQPGELDDLADSVLKGAGLMMIGGVHSFGPGGYAETPLADVLPIKMSRFERQGLDDEVSEDLHLPGPLKMMPTPISAGRFPMMLGPDQRASEAVWSELPPLRDANRFRPENVKTGGAEVLARAGPDQPLLVAGAWGDGRVLAFAGDSTWPWVMQGYQPAHSRFWRQVVFWLARKDETLEGSVWIRLPQRRFLPGQTVEFAAGAQSPSGDPIEDADFRAEIVVPGGAPQELQLVRGEKERTGSFDKTAAAGDYTIRVTADKDGQLVGSAESRFLVIEQDLELDNAAADATLLESLAAMTGGRSLVPEELPKLIQRLAEDTESLKVRTETKKSLWDTWGFLAVFVALLAAEWYLRKRWGLV